jgi:pimeloyl-ACP methyl ester carboxylesterase
LKPQIVAMMGRYGEIRIPTAVLTGANDTTVSPTIHSAALAREIALVDYEVIPDTGHALHHSEKAKILAAIDRVTSAAVAPGRQGEAGAR